MAELARSVGQSASLVIIEAIDIASEQTAAIVTEDMQRVAFQYAAISVVIPGEAALVFEAPGTPDRFSTKRDAFVPRTRRNRFVTRGRS